MIRNCTFGVAGIGGNVGAGLGDGDEAAVDRRDGAGAIALGVATVALDALGDVAAEPHPPTARIMINVRADRALTPV